MSAMSIIVGVLLTTFLCVLSIMLIVNSIIIIITMSIIYGLLEMLVGFFFIWLAYILLTKVMN